MTCILCPGPPPPTHTPPSDAVFNDCLDVINYKLEPDEPRVPLPYNMTEMNYQCISRSSCYSVVYYKLEAEGPPSLSGLPYLVRTGEREEEGREGEKAACCQGPDTSHTQRGNIQIYSFTLNDEHDEHLKVSIHDE